MIKTTRPTKRNQSGFTILELLIATTVLSVILLLVTVMITSIGNLYYKGINLSRSQDDVRSIVDDLSQHLQLSQKIVPDEMREGSGAGEEVDSICIDTTRYTWVVGIRIGSQDDSSGTPVGSVFNHVLWRDTVTPTELAGGTCPPANLLVANPSASTGGSDGTELIAPNSRLADFSVSAISPYTINVTVAYGTSDNLTGSGANTICTSQAGDQFCATATLSTTVVQRLTSSGS